MAVKWIGWYKAGVLPTYNLRSGCAQNPVFLYVFGSFLPEMRQSRVPTRKLPQNSRAELTY
jgi:hypothetical protein